MRVDYARQLMLGSDAKLEEIAERAGFADGRMLGTAFRRVYNETPSEFRSRHRSDRRNAEGS
ncbi:MAG: helix-turn-helix domain-containing protein [Verrucomicrobia bacterium]|nr:helix-turn-helix domain-containing protein [Verrucomicrobiota bacterium]MCH8525597.1 helix-turn-helix domain-containing protein [Kiritimatiellia bacterium]